MVEQSPQILTCKEKATTYFWKVLIYAGVQFQAEELPSSSPNSFITYMTKTRGQTGRSEYLPRIRIFTKNFLSVHQPFAS